MQLRTVRIYQTVIRWTALIVILAVGGCGDFFVTKTTDVESMEILNELTQVRESPHTENPLPDVYRQPTQRLAIKDGIKVFYFTKHHPVSELATLVADQMDVKSTINPATNQIVAYCKDDAQADAVQQFLELIDVPPVQVNVDCLILERFGDVTMDWETTLLVENLFGEGVTLGEDKFPNPAFPGASLREAERANFGLDFGYWIDQGVEGHQVRAVVDVLVSRGYLKILLNPQLETINGRKATVTIRDYAPIEEVRTGSAGAGSVYNITTYVWVENTLSITPYVYSDGSIGLVTDIKIGSRSKPEGVVQRAIITERSINVEENRIEPGKSLIIGGMRKSEKRSVVRGIPFLKDLPLLGILFSSKDFEEKGTEIIFILTPSISSGGIDNSKMVEQIRTKYAEPEYTNGMKGMMGKDAYTGVLEQRATDAELQRVQARMELEQARQAVEVEKERADRAVEQAEAMKQQAQQLQKKARQTRRQAQQAIEQAASMNAQTEAEQQKAAELARQKQQAIKAAQQARQQAEQAAQQAEQANLQAQQLQEKARQAQQQLEQAKRKADKTRRETAEQSSSNESPSVEQTDSAAPSNP